MSDANLRTAVPRWGSVGVATAALAVAVAVWQAFPLLLLGMILTGVPLFLVAGIVGVTDAGVETAAASSRIGFASGQPEQYNPGRVLPIPNPLQAVCWLCGVGLGGIVVIAVAA